MSRKGDCWDIAVTETLFGSLRCVFHVSWLKLRKLCTHSPSSRSRNSAMAFFRVEGSGRSLGKGKSLFSRARRSCVTPKNTNVSI